MSLTLHLGVIDVPYAQRPSPKATKVVSGTQTTGDVATWLENRYGVMAFYYRTHAADVAKLLEESLKGSLETMMLGGPSGNDPFAEATSEIEKSFRHFLDAKEMNGQPGVPTQASLNGVDHRKKSNKGVPGRPSFIDTGLYQSSFKSWVD